MTMLSLTRRERRFLLSLLLVVLANAFYFFNPSFRGTIDQISEKSITAPAPRESMAEVVRVVDGDTFEINTGEKVRLIGVDAPESVKPNTPVQCFGKEASAYLKALLQGQKVKLVRDVSETDKYGRLLRYVYLGGQFINEKLVSEGYATVATFPPDVTFADNFRNAELDARENDRGLWSPHTCDGKR